MNDRELDRLAGLIADALLRMRRSQSGAAGPISVRASVTPSGPFATGGTAHAPRAAGQWLPNPVRPEPRTVGGEPPIWSGAAQKLEDVAPASPATGNAGPAANRASRRQPIGEHTNATRAAAAGRGVTPRGAPPGRTVHRSSGRADRRVAIDVGIGVSNRHVHLSPAHVRALFGTTELVAAKPLTQPGQFAAREAVAAIGPRGRIESIRVVGPARGETQLEISLADARALGVAPPVAASGSLEGSSGGVTLQGPAGTVALERGVIVAARHLHLAPADGARWGLRNGDLLDVRCGTGPRATTFHNVLVRMAPTHVTELHLDADEAYAAGVRTGDRASILLVHGSEQVRRPLITERDVLALARAGTALPAGALLTPSARDRARALGLAVAP